MGITHAKVSNKLDGGDSTLVRPSDWNAEHIGYDWTVNGNDIYNNNSGKIGIGTSTPKGHIHLYQGDSGYTGARWSDTYTTLEIEDNENCYINFLTPNNKSAGIVWSDTDDSSSGALVYNHGNDTLELFASGIGGFEIKGNGAFNSPNIAFFATGDYGGGVGVLNVANVQTVPTSNPTNGGLLYSEAGAGKWRGTSGTITTFGPAEPHCPDCGRDFVLEWENKNTGSLTVCMWCVTEGMTKGIIKRNV